MRCRFCLRSKRRTELHFTIPTRLQLSKDRDIAIQPHNHPDPRRQPQLLPRKNFLSEKIIAVTPTWQHPRHSCLPAPTVLYDDDGTMQSLPSSIPGVFQILLPRFPDSRGWFAESWNAAKFAAAGIPAAFVQDNQSFSHQHVLRGLHYQVGQPQGKLIRVLQGHIFDVAVDLRRDSPTFGTYEGFDLAATDRPEDPLQMLWLPEGMAHGFLVLSESAEVQYKTTRAYYPQGERTILWNDPDLAIKWPFAAPPVISEKDNAGISLAQAIAQGDTL